MSEFDGDLEAALRLEPAGEGAFVTQVPVGWGQGRGSFGGLVLALLERAQERLEPEKERLLRTFSGEILAPVTPGEARLEVEVLRRGNGMTSIAARLRQQGELRAHGSGLFAKTRVEDREALYVEPPAMTPWAEVPELSVPPEFAPPFIRAFEVRPVGPLPFSGSTNPMVEGWVKLRRAPAAFGAAELIAYADAYWPVAFMLEPMPRPMVTVAFTLERCIDPATLAPDEPLYYRARGRSNHQGFFVEVRELWTAAGKLVVLNPQTFAIVR